MRNVSHNISYREYRRRVFNKALLECMCKIHGEVLNGSADCDNEDECRLADMAARMCTTFYKEELELDNHTIEQTKDRLSEAVAFIEDCVEVSEEIAEDKAADAEEEKIEIPDDQEVQLSEEDKAVLDQLFTNKNPKLQIEEIRDATVAALLAEDKKAEEIKNAVDIAQSQVSAGEDPEVMEETVRRLNSRGPTSLMHAIINNVSSQAIKDINEAGNFTNVSTALSANRQEIRNRAVMIYTLYEMANVFSINTYTDTDVRRLAEEIYHDR